MEERTSSGRIVLVYVDIIFSVRMIVKRGFDTKSLPYIIHIKKYRKDTIIIALNRRVSR
jgi:hypothetical protein